MNVTRAVEADNIIAAADVKGTSAVGEDEHVKKSDLTRIGDEITEVMAIVLPDHGFAAGKIQGAVATTISVA